MSEFEMCVLRPQDTEMLYRHYQELDAESKGCRFGIQISDYALAHFISNLDLSSDIHFAVVEANSILALAQVSKYSSTTNHRLELGISVANNARRQGFASLLWDCATAHAISCNMHEIYVIHSPHNHAMGSFCRQKELRIGNDLGERVGIWTNPTWAEPKNIHEKIFQDWPGILPWPHPVTTEPNFLPV